MKSVSLFILTLICVYACTSSTAGDVKKQPVQNDKQAKKVLLELFTSQGCSSCPPADKLVSSLAESDTNLVVISFHVDYWDGLGWKDVYSNHDYTERQQKYEQNLHAQYVYTPQAIVQGQFQMTGSNQPGILNAVKVALKENNYPDITIQSSVSNGSVSVACKLSKGMLADSRIYVVLVQNQVLTSVSRGENSGRQLPGYHVARSMKSMPLTKEEETMQLSLPEDVKPSDCSVVAFVQDNTSGKILSVQEGIL